MRKGRLREVNTLGSVHQAPCIPECNERFQVPNLNHDELIYYLISIKRNIIHFRPSARLSSSISLSGSTR